MTRRGRRASPAHRPAPRRWTGGRRPPPPAHRSGPGRGPRSAAPACPPPAAVAPRRWPRPPPAPRCRGGARPGRDRWRRGWWPRSGPPPRPRRAAARRRATPPRRGRGRQPPPVPRLGGGLAEGLLVGLLVGPHDGGHLQVTPGAGPVTGPQEAHPEAEVGVVVHRVELEHLLELHPGGVDPLCAEVGPGQGLPDRALLRREVAGPLPGD